LCMSQKKTQKPQRDQRDQRDNRDHNRGPSTDSTPQQNESKDYNVRNKTLRGDADRNLPNKKPRLDALKRNKSKEEQRGRGLSPSSTRSHRLFPEDSTKNSDEIPVVENSDVAPEPKIKFQNKFSLNY